MKIKTLTLATKSRHHAQISEWKLVFGSDEPGAKCWLHYAPDSLGLSFLTCDRGLLRG